MLRYSDSKIPHVRSKNKKDRKHIAYIMSRFPKLTETFILYEMLEMEKLGAKVEIYPLLRENQPVLHKEAEKLVPKANFFPLISVSILKAHWHYIAKQPKTYFNTLREVLQGTLGSWSAFLGAVIFFPKAVKFAYEMERQSIEHVHAHFATHPTLTALIIHRLTGIPFSFTAHGSDLHVDRTMLDKKIAACDFAVTVSSYNKELMVSESGEAMRHKIEIVHCGVDLEAFSPVNNKSDHRPFQILCVASFEEVKGHKYLIEACEILFERGLNFDCHFLGDGPKRRAIEAQINRTSIAEKFHLHGGQAREQVIRFMENSDAKVLPSVFTSEGKREGIPVVLMEAMASGLPVVASYISGIPELVEHDKSGFLVAQRDSQALAEALQQIWSSPDRRARMGNAGRRKVEKEFDLRKNAQSLYAIFTRQTADFSHESSLWDPLGFEDIRGFADDLSIML